MKSVYCAVRTGSLNKAVCASYLIPTLFFIFGWGYQPEWVQAGVHFLFYTLVASLPLLVGILFIYNYLCSLCLFLSNGIVYFSSGFLFV